MEQRQDYLHIQIDMVSRMLKKILEKILKQKSEELNETGLNEIFAAHISEKSIAITISRLKEIEDNELVNILTEQYSYTNSNIKQLANILFELSRLNNEQDYLKQKSLTLYKHILNEEKMNIDFLIFNRITLLETSLTQINII